MLKLLNYISRSVNKKRKTAPFTFIVYLYIKLLKSAFGGYWGFKIEHKNYALSAEELDACFDYFRKRKYNVISTFSATSIQFRNN